ncbi:mitogen-activated protein kinase KSS1-like [Gossypium australe]|uniref:Mitogen-activated protein kinase KSS1-like n=1 Tax=Gossypium australe TaxID=47621 RepID=A0A5B6WV30_9ROSI|nr:mitogen-activated protein kinase KSS1-like [Gossypium australe]
MIIVELDGALIDEVDCELNVEGNEQEYRAFRPCVDAFLHQHNMGNKVNDTFTKHAYYNIVIELKENFGKGIEKEKAHSHAQQWTTKPIPNYDKMVIVYGNGRATGKHAGIALELKRRRQSFGTDDDLRETIDNIDNLISTQENHDVIGDEYIDVMASPEAHFDNPSSLTNKRSKIKIKIKRRQRHGMVANALIARNKVNSRVNAISENEIWNILE